MSGVWQACPATNLVACCEWLPKLTQPAHENVAEAARLEILERLESWRVGEPEPEHAVAIRCSGEW